jgi:nitroreductase/Pyruvate/2-oxoacid:ferredoxin oxidoreductase delta subunit
MAQMLIDSNKCNQCKLCVIECPINIIRIREGDTIPSWVGGGSRLCLICGHCVAVCPPGALGLDTMKPEDCIPTGKKWLPTPEQSEHFLKARRSVRVYKEQAVEREKLAKLIDIASYAPSGHNGQPVEWLVITDKKEVKRLAGLTADWLRLVIKEQPQLASALQAKRVVTGWDSGLDTISRNAPHLIVAHANNNLTGGDFQIALEYLELAAFSQGLGSCWAGYMQGAAALYPPMAEVLQLPEGHRSFGAMLIGYPAHKLARIPIRNKPKIIWR